MTSLPRLALALVVAAGAACGRIGYDERLGPIDAAPVDAGVDGLPACPAGMVPTCTDARVCVDVAERGNADWTTAGAVCAAAGARLCADAEWAEVCACAVGLIDMAGDGAGTALEWEWVAEESGGVASKRGYMTCDETSSHAIVDAYDFRCCADR